MIETSVTSARLRIKGLIGDSGVIGLTALALVVGCAPHGGETVGQERAALGVSPASWTSLGPTPMVTDNDGFVSTGACHVVRMDPTNPKGLWVASVNGGLFHTDDYTLPSPVWVTTTDFLPSLSISAFAIDPFSPTHLVMGTGNSASLGAATAKGIVYVYRVGASGVPAWKANYGLKGNYLSAMTARGNTLLAASTGALRGPGRRSDSPPSVTAGAIFRSTDDGSSWTNLAGVGALPTTMGAVRDLVQDPNATDVHYAIAIDQGFGGAGLYKGTNDGSTWTRISDVPSAQALVQALSAPAVDGARLSVGADGALFIEVSAVGRAIYMGATLDGGQSFITMDTPKLTFGRPPINGVNVTRAAGSATIVVETGSPHELGVSGVRLSGLPGAPELEGDWQAYAVSDTKLELFNRLDGNPGNGATTALDVRGGTLQPWEGVNSGGQGDLHQGILVDPTDPTVVYVAGSTAVVRGKIQPASGAVPSPGWTLISDDGAGGTRPHADVRNLVRTPQGDLVVVSDGGPYVRTLPGSPTGRWSSLAGDMATAEFHDLAVDTLSHGYIGGTQDNGSPSQTGPGLNAPSQWTIFEGADGNDVAVDSLVTDNTLTPVSYRYTSWQGGASDFQRHTFDQTGAWQKREHPSLFDLDTSTQLVNEDDIGGISPFATNREIGYRLVLGGKRVGVWESLSAGDTVFRVPNGPRGATSFSYGADGNPDALWVAAPDGVYMRTVFDSLSRTSFQPSSYGTPLRVAMVPSDPLHAYVTTGSLDRVLLADSFPASTQVYETKDGGASWAKVTGDLDQVQAGELRGPGMLRGLVVVPDPGTGKGDMVFVGAAENGVPGVFMMSTGNPTVWTRVGVGLPNVQAWDLSYDSVAKKLGVGTLGRGTWTVDIANLDRAPTALCKDVQVTAAAGCTASIAASAFDNGSRDVDGGSLSFATNPSGPFAIGNTPIVLTVCDAQGAAAACNATLTVRDPIAPVVVAPANVTVSSCGGSQGVNVGQATARDDCAGTLVATGQVISRNGVALNPPLTVTGSSASLMPGTYVIRWSASDGFNTATANQTVTVNALIEASTSFILDDRAQALAAGGGFAAVLNAGTGTTRIGQDGRAGGIISRSAVTLLHRAIVTGDVITGGLVDYDRSDTTITGTVTEKAAVQLPPLPSLPAFPTPSFVGFNLDSNSQPQTRPPGSYSGTTNLNGSTLTLVAGDYYFENLTINSGAMVRVNAATRIFVRNALVMNAPFRRATGSAVQAIFLGFAGATLNMLTPFDGTLVAPNASVTFGTGPGLTYTGSFFGRSLRVTSGSALVCSVPS